MVIADGVLMDPGHLWSFVAQTRAFTGLRLLVESRDQLPETGKERRSTLQEFCR